MAHEKLSPRQKMIGMMYLVLTAMLALNVSKEAVEAFKKVDEGLTLTIANYAIKNNLIYQQFDRAAAENPAKAGKLKTAAYQVKERADEVFEFIQGLKIEIIKEAEKDPETPAVKGNEVIVEEIKRIDDTNVPSQILIGANENGKANDLKAILNEYREFLISVLDGKNISAEDALRKSLNTDDGKNEDGEMERWENLNFQTLPLIAVICIMSEFQLNVRNAETEVLNYLYSQIDASSFKFNRLDPIVIPNSNWITLGSDYEASVFISATDTTQAPDIFVGDVKIELDETGKGIYKVRPSSTGSKKWGGIIALKAPDGTIINYPFDAEYNVGEANVVVSATGMNVLYTGIENPIDVSVPGVSPNNIKIRITNGTLTTGRVKNPSGEYFRGNWIVKPNTPGQKVQVYVTADMNGKPMQFAPIEYRVKPLPTPVAVFAGKSSGSITRGSAVAAQGVFATLPDFDFQLVYNVTEFTVLYNDRGEDFELKSTSSNLTPQQKNLINRLTRGKNLFIKDIRAVGPDKRAKDLPPIILKIE
ncbi:MAG TPA: gliding motility protein GldM [Bacteroidales bacterium]|nr:gliding motility protein GldM [Bacteroidales bacterium]